MALNLQDDRKVYVSRGHEASYGGAKTADRALLNMADSAGYRRSFPMNMKTGNGGELTGYEHPTERQLARTWEQGALGWSRVHPDDIAIGLTHVLGAPTTTDLTGDYVHVWRMGNDSTRDVGSFEVQELVADSTQQKIVGCVAQSLTLRKDVLTPANMVLPYIGKSHTTGSDTPSAISSEPLWLDQKVNCHFAASVDSGYAGTPTQNSEDLTGTPTDYQTTLRGFNITIDNGTSADGLFTFGANTPTRARRGARTLAISLTWELDSAMEAALIQKTIAQTAQVCDSLAFELEWYSATEIASGFYYGFKMIVAKATVGDPTESAPDDSGVRTLTIPFMPLYDTADYGIGSDFGVAHFAVWNATAGSVYGATS